MNLPYFEVFKFEESSSKGVYYGAMHESEYNKLTRYLDTHREETPVRLIEVYERAVKWFIARKTGTTIQATGREFHMKDMYSVQYGAKKHGLVKFSCLADDVKTTVQKHPVSVYVDMWP